MEQPIPIQNIDKTKNKSRDIEYFCWLLVNLGSKRAKMKFYLTSLGNDRIILGYLFLWYFNPDKAQEKKPEAPAKELPKEYQRHWKVFSKKLAQRFPPK